MDKKGVSIFIGVLVLLFALLYFFSVRMQEPKVSIDPDTQLPAFEIEQDDLIKGNPESQIVLMEYSDFQCPSCKSVYPFISSLVEDFEDEMVFVYRHFPLPQFSNARLSASAGEAAAIQGEFWAMHDMIFDGQENWSRLGRSSAEDVFVGYAEELGLDVSKFRSDLSSQVVREKIEKDRLSGVQLGVRGTPTFFLNGQVIDLQSLTQTLESLIRDSVEIDVDDLESETDTEPDLEDEY